jgi:hypothetical protein
MCSKSLPLSKHSLRSPSPAYHNARPWPTRPGDGRMVQSEQPGAGEPLGAGGRHTVQSADRHGPAVRRCPGQGSERSGETRFTAVQRPPPQDRQERSPKIGHPVEFSRQREVYAVPVSRKKAQGQDPDKVVIRTGSPNPVRLHITPSTSTNTIVTSPSPTSFSILLVGGLSGSMSGTAWS